MIIRNIHTFNLSKSEQISIQNRLKSQIRFKQLEETPKVISGFDAAYFEHQAVGVIVTLRYDNFETLEQQYHIGEVSGNYQPGFLAFRELPLFLKIWEQLTIEPDLVFFDGHGYIHPRRMGLATHASFFIEKHTVGIAKRPFIGSYKDPARHQGAIEYIHDQDEVIGAIIRTKEIGKPIFVSVGNYLTLQEAIDFSFHLASDQTRIPLITWLANQKANELRQKLLKTKY